MIDEVDVVRKAAGGGLIKRIRKTRVVCPRDLGEVTVAAEDHGQLWLGFREQLKHPLAGLRVIAPMIVGMLRWQQLDARAEYDNVPLTALQLTVKPLPLFLA